MAHEVTDSLDAEVDAFFDEYLLFNENLKFWKTLKYSGSNSFNSDGI